MDEIQKVLVEAGHKDLAQEYYWKCAGLDNDEISIITRQASTNKSAKYIQFKVGDLVKLGSGRNIFKILDIEITYVAYDESLHQSGPKNYVDVTPKMMGRGIWKPKSFRDPMDGDIGDTIELLKPMRDLKEGVYEIGVIHLYYTLENTKNGKKLYHVEQTNLVPAGDIPLDKKGMGAYDAAIEKFGKEGSYVVLDTHRLIREFVGKIVKITPKGGIKVDVYHSPLKWYGQESYVPDLKKKTGTMLFQPHLSSREWYWESQRNYYIKKPYKKGDKVESLND